MLLVVDLGNTHTTLGFFEGDRLQARRTILSTAASLEALPEMLSKLPIHGIALASVVPRLSEICQKTLFMAPLLLVEKNLPGIEVLADGAGADRLMNALAAHRLFGDSLVLDLGTATTFELVEQGRFLGGAILPGWGLFAELLPEKTAQLPVVPLPEAPPPLLGQNTRDAIRSGLYYGYRDLLGGMIRRFKEGRKLTVVATGGLGHRIGELVDRVEPELTLQGLRLFWEEQHAR